MRHLKLTERMLDAIRPLRPNEVHVYLRLALMCRKPYAGDPQKHIPPTPTGEGGRVRNPKGRRLTQAALAELTGVPRRKIGVIFDSLRERGLIGVVGDHLSVCDIAWHTGDPDEREPREGCDRCGTPDDAPHLDRGCNERGLDRAEGHRDYAVALYHRGYYRNAWNEVHVSERAGGTPNADFGRGLRQRLPEPGREKDARAGGPLLAEAPRGGLGQMSPDHKRQDGVRTDGPYAQGQTSSDSKRQDGARNPGPHTEARTAGRHRAGGDHQKKNDR